MCVFVCVRSRRGQMFEWRRGRRLRILLLPGELNLRHGRDARDLWALPPHSCYLQHRGGSVILSSVFLSLRRPHRRLLTSLCRAKPLWRRVCSASPRESQQRSSKLSAAATSSRGWSRRLVGRLPAGWSRSSLSLTHQVSVSLKVQEDCYTTFDICAVARSNPDAIGEVVQVPTHFPNRSVLTTHTHTHTLQPGRAAWTQQRLWTVLTVGNPNLPMLAGKQLYLFEYEGVVSTVICSSQVPHGFLIDSFHN